MPEFCGKKVVQGERAIAAKHVAKDPAPASA